MMLGLFVKPSVRKTGEGAGPMVGVVYLLGQANAVRHVSFLLLGVAVV
jgi:hypothetical protein